VLENCARSSSSALRVAVVVSSSLPTPLTYIYGIIPMTCMP
jgi:hypothetical protein